MYEEEEWSLIFIYDIFLSSRTLNWCGIFFVKIIVGN